MEDVRIFLRSRGKVTLLLTAMNLLVFFVLDSFGDTQNAEFMFQYGAMYAPAVLENREYYRLVTCMFLHFGIEHLFGNMLLLIFLGDLLEKIAGKWRYLLIYFVGGAAGNLLSLAKNVYTDNYVVSAGASGALFAVLGALVFLVIRYRGKIPGIPGERLVFMVLLTLADGFFQEGVDHMAHLGGMAAGLVLAILLMGNMRLKRVPEFPEE